MVPDLARAAGCARSGLEAARCPGRWNRRRAESCDRAQLRSGHHAHEHPIVSDRCKIRRAVERGQSRDADRHGRRQDHGRPGGLAAGDAGARLRVPRGIRLHLQGGRRGPSARGHRRAVVPRSERVRRPQSAARIDREHGRTAVRRTRLPARFDDRKLLHRLPAASLRQPLHRPRLPLEVHVLPVAADRRWPPLPRTIGR